MACSPYDVALVCASCVNAWYHCKNPRVYVILQVLYLEMSAGHDSLFAPSGLLALTMHAAPAGCAKCITLHISTAAVLQIYHVQFV